RMLGWSGGIAIAASLAVIAAPAALGARAHTQAQACQGGTTWISVTDDQGITNLVQVGQTACLASLSCTSSDEAASSPYPGWVSVTDDSGVPWLYPAGSSLTVDRQTCSSAPAAPQAPVANAGVAAVISQPTFQSPYPGWIVVTGDDGVPYLYPVQAGG
ncbi:MAG TPA: hypothetical protein VNY33_06915, partial [Gaiellaceae bacterium]|nr:hypothetical protein [Gaiellaceae bacterium]